MTAPAVSLGEVDHVVLDVFRDLPPERPWLVADQVALYVLTRRPRTRRRSVRASIDKLAAAGLIEQGVPRNLCPDCGGMHVNPEVTGYRLLP